MNRNEDNIRDDVCAQVQNGLSLFVGGDLESALHAEIARHLGQCAVCSEQARAARSARDLLVSALALSERRGPDLWRNVRAVLTEDGLIRGQPVRAQNDLAADLTLSDRPDRREVAAMSALAPFSAGVPSIAGATKPRTPKTWSSPRFLSYAAAAAAALIAGLWLGRAAFHPGTTPDSGTRPQNFVSVPPHEGPAIPIVPVGETDPLHALAGDTDQLHPLRRGEVPLHMGARSYFDSAGIQVWPANDPTQATTVEQRTPRWQ
jgi:hypothetical protein